MFHEDKANQLSYGAPQQIHTEVLDTDVSFSIDGAGGGHKILQVLEVISEQDLFPVEFGASPFAILGRRGLLIGLGGDSHSRHQVVAFSEEGLDRFLAGIVGIGNQDGFLRQERYDLQKQPHQIIE